MKKRKKVFLNIIFFVVVVLLLALAVGLIVHFRRAGEQTTPLDPPPAESFKVVCGEQEYTGTENTLLLPDNGDVRFDVQGTESYKVSVEANIDFYYTVDGNAHSFCDVDFTKYFVPDGNVYDDYFVIVCAPDRYKVTKVLSVIWDSDAVVLPDNLTQYFYRLVVTSAEGSVVSFVLDAPSSVDSLTINRDKIYF